MIPLRTDNRIPSGESRPSTATRFPARSARRAKAQPRLRTGAGGVGGLVAVSVDSDFYFPGYDNNGNVVGCRNVDGIIEEDLKDALDDSLESLTIRSAKGRIDCEFVFQPFGLSKRKGNSPCNTSLFVFCS